MSLKKFIKECHENLVLGQDQESIDARAYLLSRNILEKSIKSGIIGYCQCNQCIPDPVRYFGEECRKEDEDRWDMSNFLRGRLIVPVLSEFNELVGLASRKPSHEKGNTWWNLPSPFKKGSHLFMLNLAKKTVFEKNKIYLVEGYMDAIVLRQSGLDNVVSLMGTALTQRKIGLIARYCNNVCFCFDSDENEAGQKANDMAIAILKKLDFCESISCIKLPIKQDPDVYVTEHGLENFLAQEVVLKDSDIEKICRKVVKQKHFKDIAYGS